MTNFRHWAGVLRGQGNYLRDRAERLSEEARITTGAYAVLLEQADGFEQAADAIEHALSLEEEAAKRWPACGSWPTSPTLPSDPPYEARPTGCRKDGGGSDRERAWRARRQAGARAGHAPLAVGWRYSPAELEAGCGVVHGEGPNEPRRSVGKAGVRPCCSAGRVVSQFHSDLRRVGGRRSRPGGEAPAMQRTIG